MNCPDARERLQDLLDGALGRDEAEALREHLGDCAACAGELAAFEAVREVLRAVPGAPAPPGFAEEVLERLPVRSRGGGGRLLRFAPLAAAAALLVAVLVAAPWEARSPRPAAPLEVARTAETAPGRDLAVAKEEAVAPARDGVRGATGESAGAGPGPGASPLAAPGMTAVPGASPAPVQARARRSFVVSAREPDTEAGLILVELEVRRARLARRAGDKKPDAREGAGAELAERLESDDGGVPARLLLSLTADEIEYLLALLRSRQGVRLVPANGPRGGPGDPTPGRIPVEFLFDRE